MQLMARKLAGEASAEELAELDHLLMTQPEFLFQVELLQQLWKKEQEPEGDTKERYLKHRQQYVDDFDAAIGEETAVPRHRYKKISMVVAGIAAVLAVLLIIRFNWQSSLSDK